MGTSNKIIKEVKKEIEEAQSFDDVVAVLTKYKAYELTPTPLGMAFEKMFIKDMGFSSFIKVEELVKYHRSFYTTNGGAWCRTENCYLGNKYNITRKHDKNRISEVKAEGFKKNSYKQDVRADIRRAIKKERCAILDISSKIECDHRDGKKDEWRMQDKKLQKLEDFQPLCKTANIAKRDHCTKCKETGKRYDAKRLGYSESFLVGDENTLTCAGCYWYDPIYFNKTISENYVKKDS